MGMVPPRIIPPQGGSVIEPPCADLASAGKYSLEEVSRALTFMANAGRYAFPEYEKQEDGVEFYEELFSLSLPDLGWFARLWHYFLAGCDLIARYLGFPCEPPLEPKREQGYYIMTEREMGE